MATSSPSLPVSPATTPEATPIPKSYAKGVATTPDPWELCARLEYGGDRSFAWSVRQQVVRTAPTGRAKIETQLLTTLASPDRTPAGCAFLCQMLAMVGTAKSVPALSRLLLDPASTESARYALEAIPGHEASAALRTGLTTLTAEAKAGLIGSIAARRDSAARPALVALSTAPAEPAVVREAATRALEHLPPP
jgi:thioredoxin-like negative regulator of GroEL